MDNVVDFTNCKRVYRDYGGSDRKFAVIYNGDVYLLKFSDNHAKKDDISTSSVNNTVSEYISSHISASIGLPTHETVLGFYGEEVVVGRKVFRNLGEQNIEFSEMMKAVYSSSEVNNRHVLLQQIYSTIEDPINNLSSEIKEASIERYWDTFVVDAFVGNFDRHMGNWGYIANDTSLRLAPVYDFGSTLFPNLSDIGMRDIQDDKAEMLKRCLVFPSPVLCVTTEKTGKVGYYDMLSSNYDNNCSKAVMRIAPKIDMEKVACIIDETPLITDTRKNFYKNILALRKEVIIDRAYERCKTNNYDKESFENILTGKQRDEGDVKKYMHSLSIAAHTKPVQDYLDETPDDTINRIMKQHSGNSSVSPQHTVRKNKTR